MNIKNLQRAAEIAEQLPRLKNARQVLSGKDAATVSVYAKGQSILLPQSLYYNILAAINAEINGLEKEITTL